MESMETTTLDMPTAVGNNTPPEILPPQASDTTSNPPADAPVTLNLQILLNDKFNVVLVINENQSGIGPITFSTIEAKNLGFYLLQKAIEGEIYSQQKTAAEAVV
jgi:hypothetical protein